MEAMLKPSAEESSNEVWTFLALAFGFSWVMWIGAIKLGLGEEFLNVGTAGPALAAVILSRHRDSDERRRSGGAWLSFIALLAFCWIVLSLHYLWRNGSGLQFRLNPVLLLPALFPAWILSRVFSSDAGVRGLLQRLLHPPNRWSVYALLFFPLLLGIPTVLAHVLGARLVWPESQGSIPIAVATGFVFFLFNLLFVAALEEPGWRGFLLDRLQHKLSPLSASFLVWLPWALWHAPLDYYRPGPFSWINYVLLRVVFLIPLTIILTWFYNRSGRSIQTTALFHAAMNTFPFVAPYYQAAWGLIFVFAAYAVISDRMWSRTWRPVVENVSPLISTVSSSPPS
jgi:membrane protease YdiL (CAAX protease family)